MCVQPMKSIAAVALTDGGGGDGGTGAAEGGGGFDARTVAAAGVLTGGAVLVLGAAGLMEAVNAVVPLAVVCGLQIGVGLRLASRGIRDIQRLSWGGSYDCIGLAVGCALLSMFWLRDAGNEKADEPGGRRSREERGGDEGSPTAKNSQTNNGDVDGLAGTVANSVAASSDGEQCFRTEGDNVMEMGKLGNSHLSDATITTQLQQPCLAGSTEAQASAAFSNPSSLSPESPRSPQSPPSCVTRLLKRACCCLDPVPRTPHPVGIYLFLIGAVLAAVTLATAGPHADYDLPLRPFGAPVVVNAFHVGSYALPSSSFIAFLPYDLHMLPLFSAFIPQGATPYDWRTGFLQGTLPQLPLTALNSVISVCCLAHALYPDKRRPSLVRAGRTDAVVTRREVAVSVGLLNLLLCPLGSAPNCHGAGGLAGQHRFGARAGTAVVLLGFGKMLLAVVAGRSALTLLDALPVAVLGVMLAIAGLELAGTGTAALLGSVQGRDVGGEGDGKARLRENALVALVTAVVILALQKTHYGAISGCVVHLVCGDGSRQLLGWTRAKKWRRKRRASAEEGERTR